MFGLGHSAVRMIIGETFHVMGTQLLYQYVLIPHGEKMRKVMEGFKTCLGIPQAAETVGGLHIHL